MVQWLELNDSTAGGPGSIPGWGTKIPHALQPKKTSSVTLESLLNISVFKVLFLNI